MMDSLFLLRPRPIAGESLSSWRQRVAWVNGYQLFALGKGVLRRSDPDIGLHEHEFNWVSATHDVPVGQISSMTLRQYLGKVVDRIESRRHPSWWLRSRYGRALSTHGAMFCPQCLATDSTPYFRLDWRLAFNVVCPVHKVRYRDHCQACGAPPWPAGASGTTRLAQGFHRFDICWQCGEQLSKQSMIAAMPDETISHWLSCTGVEFDAKVRPVLEVFSALRAMAQLCLRTKTRAALIKTGRLPDMGGSLHKMQARLNAVELLDVSTRQTVLKVAATMIANWPSNFLSIAGECNISRADFCGSAYMHPKWVEDIILRYLARQNRTVNPCRVRNEVMLIRAEGLEPTKALLRRRLCWQGDIDASWLT